MIGPLLAIFLNGAAALAAVDRSMPRDLPRQSNPAPETAAKIGGLAPGSIPALEAQLGPASPVLPEPATSVDAATADAGPSAASDLRAMAAMRGENGPALAAVQGFDGGLLGKNLTKEYRTLSVSAGPPKGLRDLKHYKILFVPGFMTGAFIRLSQTLGRDPQPWHYFGPQMRWLKELGVEHEIVDVHTEQTTTHNARVLIKAIDSSKKDLILITHSKGGLDALAALLRLQKRGGLEKVRGWIAVQSPFLGAPGADKVASNRLLKFWVSRFLEHSYIGGCRHAITRMTTAASERFYRRRKAAITELLHSVPTIAFTSWRQAGILDVIKEMTSLGLSLNPLLNPRIIFSPLWGLALIMKGASETLVWLNHKSDGLVPAAHARLPEMDYVEEAGVDHLVPFIDQGGPFDRVTFTKSLLKMLLKRIKTGMALSASRGNTDLAKPPVRRLALKALDADP